PGADARCEVRDSPFRLLPYLWPCCVVVGFRIRRVAVLKNENRIRRFFRNSPGCVDVVIRGIRLCRYGHDYHISTKRLEVSDFFDRTLISHHEDGFVTANRACEGKSYAGVSACRFNDCAARPQSACSLGSIYHRNADSVFNRAARVQGLHLREHQRLYSSSHLVQPDKWCITNQAQNGFFVIHSSSASLRIWQW